MTSTDPSEPSFLTGEGLRQLIHRLNEASGAPRPRITREMAPEERQQTVAEILARAEIDRETAALFGYVVRKYAQLCRKWDRDPTEAAVAAFHAMTQDYILQSDDPWAIITIAVRKSVIAEAQSEKLLISPDRARQGDTIDWASPHRAGEHEEFYFGLLTPSPPEAGSPTEIHIHRVITEFFAAFGWHREIIDLAVTYVINRLLATSDLARAHEALRRDPTMPAQLDMPPEQWRVFLRILFDGRSTESGPLRRGLLHRVAMLDPGSDLDDLIDELADDSDLVDAVLLTRGRR